MRDNWLFAHHRNCSNKIRFRSIPMPPLSKTSAMISRNAVLRLSLLPVRYVNIFPEAANAELSRFCFENPLSGRSIFPVSVFCPSFDLYMATKITNYSFITNNMRHLHSFATNNLFPHSSALRSACLVYPDLSGPQAGMTAVP